MAYTDPHPMSQSRIWSIILVVAIHVLGLYAMLNGGYEVVKKKLTELEVIDVKTPPPPPKPLPPPPPPDTKLPPPPVVPPPLVQTNTPPPPATIVSQPAPPPFNPPPAPPQAAPPPPAPPAPVALSPRGDAAGWFSPDDIPDAVKRDRPAGVIGVTGFTLQVGPTGKPTSCSITASSGESRLDDATCRIAMSRGRFKPGSDSAGQPTGGVYSRRVKWVIQN